MNNFWNFNFADIIGIALSIISICVASLIPNAIMSYKVKLDLKINIKGMQEKVNKLRNTIISKPIKKKELVNKLNLVDNLLIEYTQYGKRKFKKRAQELQNEYNELTYPFKDDDNIDNSDAIRLLDKYYSFLVLLCIDVGINTIFDDNNNNSGGNNNEK